MGEKVFVIRTPSIVERNLVIDPDKCNRCDLCVEACRRDVLLPGKGKNTPIVAYPEECWFCGCCVEECPTGAIRLVYPLYQRVAVIWKDKETGEIFYFSTEQTDINKKKENI